MAMKEVSGLRHTASIQQRLKIASEGLRDALQGEDNVIRNFKSMAEVKLTDSVFASVMKNVFDVELDVKRNDISAQKANKLDKVAKSIETEINLEGATLWGLFNGITRYTNHHAVDSKKKDEYLMLGAGYNTNLVGYNEIMRWVEENTIAQEFVMDTK